MKKKWVKPTIILGTVLILLFGFLIFYDQVEKFETNATIKNSDENEEKEVVEKDPLISEETKENANPFGDMVSASGMNRERLIKYMHFMSHQKVEAQSKWGFYEITDDRIAFLQESFNTIDSNAFEVKERASIRNILDRWSNGDFSQVDSDHNTLYRNSHEDEDRGMATGILSEDQEKNFIENNKDFSKIRGINRFDDE
ncbi:PRK06770 family protein [Oceanobacillus iheyensis]|uniref:Uncharacterized protein n=1 Tax=Oceanobacillus iheyensis (strain DSM 14371 / CIP 107618 / JCM 11309 / KCTC 3954 / HTE831) TaxID=221109 RepID=Q8CVA6_OCEIH|nr:PRK06770 family protein [Oceanobacillus iheyensis]BAC12807.1 hypothetical protein [Oceanobacillus iheyensis HTE831]